MIVICPGVSEDAQAQSDYRGMGVYLVIYLNPKIAVW